MPNKTIYVSDNDTPLFEEAKNIAGEALSSVITRALREYVSHRQEKAKGMKEVKVHVGSANTEREQRFVGMIAGEWQGFSNDKQWWLTAKIYRTQKNNWAVHLVTVCKASLLTNKRAWKENGDYLVDPRHAELIVGEKVDTLKNKLPHTLFAVLSELSEKDEKPIEYLDI